VLSIVRGGSLSLAVRDTIIRPLPLTDAEYLRYKPAEDSSS
jgi:hypothetical protein